jgi:quinol monooxygenase YgiN
MDAPLVAGDDAAPVTYPAEHLAPSGARIMGRNSGMSVLVIGKFQGDTGQFSQALTDRADEFAKIAEGSRSAGAIHHRFGIGDGFVVLVDEWESVEQFQQFFANPELQAFIGSVGAAPAPPEITITEAITSSDQF